MIIIDYVLYNGEPIIEFRLKYWNEYVDKSIIVETIYTLSVNKKMIYILILIRIFLKNMKTQFYFIRAIIYQLKKIFKYS